MCVVLHWVLWYVIRLTCWVIRVTFYVVRDTCYVLRVVFYINVTWWRNTRARMVVNQHQLSHQLTFDSTLKNARNREATASSLSTYCYPMFDLTFTFSSLLIKISNCYVPPNCI